MVRPVVRGLRAHGVVALDQAVALVLHRQVVDEAPRAAVEPALAHQRGDVAHGVVLIYRIPHLGDLHTLLL